jgi:hypothetical protein
MTALTYEGFNESAADYREMPVRVRGAVVRSLNRAIVSGQAAIARLIAGDTGLKVKDVKTAFSLDKASDGRPSASVAAGFKRIPLIQFNVKDSSSKLTKALGGGVSYTIGNVRKSIPNAFVATMKTGHRGVFVRVGKKRLPIRELYGPSIGKVFLKFQDQGQSRAEEAFLGNFEHELGRLGLNAADILGESDEQDDARTN